MGTEAPGWTQQNLSRLFTAMKTHIPEHERKVQYGKSLKTLDWSKVAFPPFSAKACQQKWSEISYKMRKLRSLPELLDEAEGILSNKKQIYPIFLKKPTSPWNIYFVETHAEFRKQHPELKPSMLFKLALNQYKNLPQKEKAYYVDKFKLENKKYKSKINHFRSGASAHDEDLPAKLCLTGYNVFCKEQYRCMKAGTEGNMFKKWAEQWRSLSTKEKRKYTNKSKELKLQHKTQQEKERQQKVPSCETKRVTSPSDSEDEDLEDSSSEDEENYVNFNEDEEEDEDEDEDENMEAEDF